jgi:putative tributyrin esterase
MALLQAGFYSPVLNKQVAMNVLVPDAGNGPFPVFYLLHGFSDDHSMWLRRTRIEMFVSNLPLIVAMPDGFHGFYTDNEEGPAYGKYMTQDVIGFVERTFHARKDRAGRCVGGLSMGGYGALRLALENPQLFVSANSHSGAAQAWFPEDPDYLKKDPARRRVFGLNPSGTHHDIFHLARELKKSRKPIPKLLIDCGREDYLFKQNQEIHRQFKKIGIPHEYREFSGAHDWSYWEEHVKEAVAFHAKALKIKK